MATSRLQALASRHRIAGSFTDNFGHHRVTEDAVLVAMLQALGEQAPTDSGENPTADGTREANFSGSIVCTLGDSINTDIFLPVMISSSLEPRADASVVEVRCCVLDEQSKEHHFTATLQRVAAETDAVEPVSQSSAWRFRATLPESLSCGYHHLRIATDGTEHEIELTVIVVPRQAIALQRDERPVGVSVQLYSLRSENNWGIGDLTDLQALCSVLSAQGVDTVGLNPLHSLYLAHPHRMSPYSPSSRRWLNPLYIDVLRVPGANASQSLETLMQSEDFIAGKTRARESSLVDYSLVSALKLEALKLVFRQWYAPSALDETSSADSEMVNAQQRYQKFVTANGDELERQARFEAFDRYFSQRGAAQGWPDWPSNYQNPATPESRALAAELSDDIAFSCFLQWAVDEQLAAARDHAQAVGLRHGLYMDLAVGVDRQGGEIWGAPDTFALGMHIGAPPDALGPLGQDWSLVPYRPQALQNDGYHEFVEVLRASMRYAGILRIDHVMGFARQYWCVPALQDSSGASPGAYINFPLEDLLGIVALESQRNHCLVVGEDLGTVPEGFRDALEQRGLFGYRVLYFEKEADGHFRAPENYARRTLATASTHDLPTLGGFLNRRDIQWRDALGQYADATALANSLEQRREELESLLQLLPEGSIKNSNNLVEFTPMYPEGEKPDAGESPAPVLEATPDFVDAVHRRLGACSSGILVLQLEDLLANLEMANLPGTINEHPNWQRKSSVVLEDLAGFINTQTGLADVVGNRAAPQQKAS